MQHYQKSDKQQGFTLVELLMSIALMALIFVGMGSFFAQSMYSYLDLKARTQAVQNVEWGMRLLQRDIRRAAPRSLRATAEAIELLRIADAGRYRAGSGSDDAGNDRSSTALSLNSQINSFGLTGGLNDIDNTSLNNHRLMIFPEDPNSLYQSAEANNDIGTITRPQTITVNGNNSQSEDEIELALSHSFNAASDTQRVFLIDTAVQYRCDPGLRTLTRYQNYTPKASLSLPNDGESSVIMSNVAACTFDLLTRDLSQGYSQLVATVEVEDDSRAKSPIRLVLQTHVVNLR